MVRRVFQYWSVSIIRDIRDVVCLYINPPDRAVVLSEDEKMQIQVLSRKQKPLPMMWAIPRPVPHDHKRNGTACLLAALDVATGRVVVQMTPRHRSKEFLAFLDHVANRIGPGTKVHVNPPMSPATNRTRPANG